MDDAKRRNEQLKKKDSFEEVDTTNVSTCCFVTSVILVNSEDYRDDCKIIY